ncbi:glycosyltransferase family 4 [Pyrrhoderma noxium]|uniref:Alpha-1,3/1,6-mannosyltransferase ALG2 n=1 Tax=Pyrrhoderma noxium TaxID=2282107 RepID=A0A286UV02_9AGAM|nr:glycosyltransferase family 4 [Pyrrhoderma noxium]
MERKLKVAFIHPDLGIGGAERLVVDAALGLQRLGHSVDIYTSHHDPSHCFEETRDGTLRVHYIQSPFPRNIGGKMHILCAHLRQLHLTKYLLRDKLSIHDVFFVDQLSTCVPFLRAYARRRVLFYVHFPDKLLADGQFEGIMVKRKRGGLLKRFYRMPMDWLEEKTTGCADLLLANSHFTSLVFETFFSIPRSLRVVYPGINISAYVPLSESDLKGQDIQEVISDRPTLLSLNRFEKKKNIALALKAFAELRSHQLPFTPRLVLAGGYDPRVGDNVETLEELITLASDAKLTFRISSPSKHTLSTLSVQSLSNTGDNDIDVLFLLSFSSDQRAALLTAQNTLALLYTPTNEHFGIVPVEAMACGVPVLACPSGGPLETVKRTGWLVEPDPSSWATLLRESIINLSASDRLAIAECARNRVRELFSLEAMTNQLDEALKEVVDMGLEITDAEAVETMIFITFWKDILLAIGIVGSIFISFKLGL